MRPRLTKSDYADMAIAAEGLARMSVGARERMNKALSEYYRALSVRDSVAAEQREEKSKMTGEV